MALVKDLIKGQSFLLTLETHRDNVLSALKKFALHEISSAPVFDETKFIGFIDLLDITTFLLAVLAKPGGSDLSFLKQGDPLEYANDVSSFQPAIGDTPQVDEKQLSLQQLNNLVDLSRRNPFIATLPEQPVFEVLVALAKGLHRVAVCNSHDEIVNIVTQSTVVRWLNEDPANRIGAVGEKTLEELGFAFNDVPTVGWDSKMITALQKTHLGRDTGIAVVNDQGVLVGNVSASDLKLLIRPNSGLSFDSLFELISTILPRINKLNGRESESFVASCTPATKLSEVVKKLAELHIHRLFVVDKEGRPVGSISISHVCEILILHNHDALNRLGK